MTQLANLRTITTPKGTSLYTTSTFKPGSLVLSSSPIASGLDDQNLELKCSNCIGEGKISKCSGCKVVGYCSKVCVSNVSLTSCLSTDDNIFCD